MRRSIFREGCTSMGGFVTATLAYPTVLFSFLLAIVVVYWLLVLFGAATPDDDLGGDGFLDHVGLGGVPATATLSLLIAVGWFTSLAGGAGLRAVGRPNAVTTTGLLVVALVVAFAVTRLAVRPLRTAFGDHRSPSRNDFVGRVCVVRTGRVDADFGQAEVTAADGSSAIVQVRQNSTATLTAGSTALIYDLDPDGGFFWITPMDTPQ
jgi:amino acid transporter